MNSNAARFSLSALAIVLLLPFNAQADETAPAAVPAVNEAPLVSASHPQAAALKAELDALGTEATAEQLEAARQNFISSNNIATDEAPQLLQAVEALQSATENAPAEDAVHDLSPLGMYKAADWVVKSVMIGLILASILTWTVWLAKSFELIGARRRLRRELPLLQGARNLNQAAEQPFDANSLSAQLIADAREELRLSNNSAKEGIKERVSFRLERLVAASGRRMNQGTGILATIGSTAPFIGLFGTVWGIMNSFIGIAKSQTTNLAVVAPGIAEALLATALGLVAAIPAVMIYNTFSRSIAAYRAQVADASAQVLLLVSRDLDQPSSERQTAPIAKAV